jgi:hypothetical protein
MGRAVKRAALLPFVGMRSYTVFSHGGVTSAFCRNVSPIWPQSRTTIRPMRTVAVIFALALTTIAFEIFSDAVTRSEFSHPEPDPATTAVAHALKRG